MTSPAAAGTFRLDVKGREIRAELVRAGVRPVLIKGPALSELLYGDLRSREYADVDLLVAPDAVSTAERALSSLGFRRFEKDSVVRQSDPAIGLAVGFQGASHAASWIRDSDAFAVDLHDSLPQAGASPVVVWGELSRHLAPITVAGRQAETLDAIASALLIALHAAHHGPGWNHATADLERAVEVLELGCWIEARELAVRLIAESAMGVGLGLIESGAALARQLGLSTEPTVAHRLAWSGRSWSAGVIDALVRMDSNRDRLRLIVRIVFPAPAALCRGSQLARSGRAGVWAAYALRPIALGRLLARALRERRAQS